MGTTNRGRPLMSNRLYGEMLNFQNSLMRIVNYNDSKDIVVEFQDEHKARVHSNYNAFLNGSVKNPYCPCVYGVGMIGLKYPSRINKIMTAEYKAWCNIMQRCFDEKYKDKHITYKDVTCCNSWLLYENFYEWLHSQANFDKWLEGYRWDIDKDILQKNNKIYSPDMCLLVPHNVNVLFMTRRTVRGDLPIGVTRHNKRFRARCDNPLTNTKKHLGVYYSPEEAFNAYKKYKEALIKKIASLEYDKGNITKECYNAMMSYEVEITD